MMRNNRGLSTVVTTLIIVLLVLAAVGLIWGPIKSLLTNSASSLDQTKCFNLNIKITKAKLANGSTTNYSVTLKRFDAASNVKNAGVKLIFYNNTESSNTIDFNDDVNGGKYFGSPQVYTAKINGNVTNATKIEVLPYYIDEDTGNKQVCSTSAEFKL